jgi:hypothetical protein
VERHAPEIALFEVVGSGVEGGAFRIGSGRAEADEAPTHADHLADSG